jgi:hypothetical protein
MTDISLTKDEIDLLKQLEAAGPRGRTISGAKSREGPARLVKAGYVKDHAASIDTVAYLITDAGRRALAQQND